MEYIGLEMGSVWSRLGSKVTVVEDESGHLDGRGLVGSPPPLHQRLAGCVVPRVKFQRMSAATARQRATPRATRRDARARSEDVDL